MNFLWIPYIIFKNTDNDEAVTVDGDTRTLMSVTRQGGFTRSGPEVADEVKCIVNCKSLNVIFYIFRLKFSKEMKTS